MPNLGGPFFIAGWYCISRSCTVLWGLRPGHAIKRQLPGQEGQMPELFETAYDLIGELPMIDPAFDAVDVADLAWPCRVASETEA